MVRNNSAVVVKEYPNQNYYTYFNKETGFFARIEKPGFDEPFWAQSGPELLDISITNWCDQGCEFCYRNSDTHGGHISLENYEEIIKQARDVGVLQVALGGGNPTQHPKFAEILKITKEKYGIVPSYTTNGKGLNKNVLEATKKYCGAVAVSAYPPYKQLSDAIDVLAENKIKTNIHYVLKSDELDTAIDWLKEPPAFLNKINAIVFLNYKPVGQHKDEKLLLKQNPRFKEFFALANRNDYKFKIGFDSCNISGIVNHITSDKRYYEGCDAGRFSAYISEDMKMYPCSFLTDILEGIDLRKENMANVWKQGVEFKKTRKNMTVEGSNKNCTGCGFYSECKGGCPFLKEINLCDRYSNVMSPKDY